MFIYQNVTIFFLHLTFVCQMFILFVAYKVSCLVMRYAANSLQTQDKSGSVPTFNCVRGICLIWYYLVEGFKGLTT